MEYINNRKHINELKNLNLQITNTFKEIQELNDCCFNIWKYKNKIDQLKLLKTNLLYNHPFIKKFDTLGKHYSDKICYYCNYGVKNYVNALENASTPIEMEINLLKTIL